MVDEIDDVAAQLVQLGSPLWPAYIEADQIVRKRRSFKPIDERLKAFLTDVIGDGGEVFGTY